MRTAKDVINRLRHDRNVDNGRVRVTYLDRFLGPVEKPFSAFDFNFADADPGDESSVPQHRILSFRYDGEVVWDKEKRLDAVFGSSGTTESILDVASRHPELPTGASAAARVEKTAEKPGKRDERGEFLLRRLGYSARRPPGAQEAPFRVDGLEVFDETPCGWRVRALDDSWTVETKIELPAEDVERVSHLVARLSPPGSTAYLQADAHGAGNVYVGLVVEFDDRRIPVSLVSADVGCGISIVPVSAKRTAADASSLEDLEYRTFVLGCMRRALKRGKIAENGTTECRYVRGAASFYDDIELDQWLDEMTYVLKTIGIDRGGGAGASERDRTLEFVARFAQTLGSSGNHFMELSTDGHGDDWLVVHSGSRGLGAMVHSAIAYACKATTGGFEVATGPLAVFYQRAYGALNGFAKLNRIACAVAVLEEMGDVSDAPTLLAEMRSRRLFSEALSGTEDPGISASLLSGLTHNGIKAFVDHGERRLAFLACKGAIAVSRRGSVGIVALRAGEGCVVFALVDEACPWKEIPVSEAVGLQNSGTYFATADRDGILLAGHGAGRTRSATSTSRMSTFEEIQGYFEEVGVVANIAPGVLGDNPRVAYKPSSEILGHLPLREAASWSMLKTRVSHKEGISFKLDEVERCSRYIQGVDLSENPLAPLWHDIAVCRRTMPAEEADRRAAAAEDLFAKLKVAFAA